MTEIPIETLLQKCRRGNADAQCQLYERNSKMLFAVCLRYAIDRPEAQDMLQESFLTIFRDLHQYKGDGALEAWLHKVTVRTALQHLRRKNPLRFASDFGDLPAGTFSMQPDTELNREAILHLVRKLPAGYRTVFNLHCLEAYSYAEIAGELGIAESSVRSQYARACQHLRGLVDALFTGVV